MLTDHLGLLKNLFDRTLTLIWVGFLGVLFEVVVVAVVVGGGGAWGVKLSLSKTR